MAFITTEGPGHRETSAGSGINFVHVPHVAPVLELVQRPASTLEELRADVRDAVSSILLERSRTYSYFDRNIMLGMGRRIEKTRTKVRLSLLSCLELFDSKEIENVVNEEFTTVIQSPLAVDMPISPLYNDLFAPLIDALNPKTNSQQISEPYAAVA